MWIPTQRRKYYTENTSLQNQTVNKHVQNEATNVQREFGQQQDQFVNQTGGRNFSEVFSEN